ncbi:MAG: hypothetical protein HQK84_07225 [Nitrospinae bacterium]|nr:hypothetical protein [Nitrospinota bacterium]
MKCDICEKPIVEERQCELCGTIVCEQHFSFNDEILTCDYCMGKIRKNINRDYGDFAGTGE